jgi:hypothetical protein
MLRDKDLSGSQLAIFNSILSARLICVIDFIFAEINSDRYRRMVRGLLAHNRLAQRSFSRSRILALPQSFVARRQENLISPAFDNAHSVPVQAA